MHLSRCFGIRRSIVTLPLLALSFTWTSNALAQEARVARTGFTFGLRTGAMIPIDPAEKEGSKGIAGQRPSDVTKFQVPLQLDVGYRPNPYVMLGVYGIGSRGPIADNESIDAICSDGAKCKVGTLSGGLQALFSLRPFARYDPWLGLGIGYGRLRFARDKDGDASKASSHGLSALIQAGLDINVSPQLSFGPYLAFTGGRFTRNTITASDKTERQTVDEPAMHYWTTIGLRVAFLP